MNAIENIIFDIAEALRVPVLILALLALAVTLIELGAFIVELMRRRRRDYRRLETASVEARSALQRGDEASAKSALRPVAWSTAMARALAFMVDQTGKGHTGDRLAKGLADFDFRSMHKLERTRLLVRAGPALGLMGTLIPLSPALEGLAKGNTDELSDNLRVAFSVTVLGLLIGAVAFAISLVRDRLYGQDLSDLEFVAATLAPDAGLGDGAGPVDRPAAGARAAAAAGAAAPPPPPPAAAAAAGNKPPPPKGAKPLGVSLPPPLAPGASPAGGGPKGAPTPPAPSPAGASKPGAASAPSPTLPGTAGGGTPPAPMPAGGAPAAAKPPAHAAPTSTDSQSPPAGGATPAPPPGEAAPHAHQPPPGPAPLPAPPIPEPPTEKLPSNPPGERPTEADDKSPGDGHGAPKPDPEIQ